MGDEKLMISHIRVFRDPAGSKVTLIADVDAQSDVVPTAHIEWFLDGNVGVAKLDEMGEAKLPAREDQFYTLFRSVTEKTVSDPTVAQKVDPPVMTLSFKQGNRRLEIEGYGRRVEIGSVADDRVIGTFIHSLQRISFAEKKDG